MKTPPPHVLPTGRALTLALSQESCTRTVEMLQRTIGAGGETGFAGFAVDLSSTAVDVWWCGTVPTALQEAAEGSDIEVRIHGASHTLDALRQALDMVMGERVGSAPLFPMLRELGITVNTGSIAHDGSGLSFTVSVARGLPHSVLERASHLISEATHVPVRVVLGDAPVPLTA